MSFSSLIGVFLSLMVVMVLSENTSAQTIERLIMPGPVIKGHAKFENNCSGCHRPFKRVTQKSLCGDCHKKISRDIKSRLGFHGKSPGARGGECKTCHTEHKGRDANIILLDKDTFNHNFTDFPLRGAHSSVACGACHQKGQLFRQAKSECIDCHRKDDAHKARLGARCADCHIVRSWKARAFDHKRRTGFALVGRHAGVGCISCHANQRYKNTPTQCAACHRINDIHRGRLGAKCETCHDSRSWSSTRFNHDRETKFPLKGRHRGVKCETCHTKPLTQQKLKTECISCHKPDDVHFGRNGTKCAACHSSEGWKRVRFDHNRQTRFPLKGRHAKAACEACHRGTVKKGTLGTQCVDCHSVDDVHKGQEGRLCQQCHEETGWHKKVKFDHDLTRFPLMGQHAVAPCEQCHSSRAFRNTARDCVQCHASEDVHRGSLGKRCETCHTPNGWAFWKFDHNRQTKFALNGGHEGLKCVACHKQPTQSTVSISSQCGACHFRDDIHNGDFGADCQRCHTTRTFKEIRVR